MKVKTRLAGLLLAVLIVTGLAFSACRSNSPEGLYVDSTGHISIEFRGGKAYLNLGGMADPDGTPYDVKDKKITIHYPAEGMLAAYSTMMIEGDGSLQGAFGTLHKK